jgi:phage baseplate assembly protein V
MPEIGEHVLCVFLPNSIEDGFVIGSYYTDSNMPKNGEIGIYRTEYADGTIIEYDLNTSTARINSEYTVEVKAETVNVEATNINITGNVTINGILTVTDDAIISGISSKNHVHGGVYSGSSTTNPPQ